MHFLAQINLVLDGRGPPGRRRPVWQVGDTLQRRWGHVQAGEDPSWLAVVVAAAAVAAVAGQGRKRGRSEATKVGLERN